MVPLNIPAFDPNEADCDVVPNFPFLCLFFPPIHDVRLAQWNIERVRLNLKQ